MKIKSPHPIYLEGSRKEGSYYFTHLQELFVM